MTIPPIIGAMVALASASLIGTTLAAASAAASPASVPEVTCSGSSRYTVAATNADPYSQTVPKLHCFATNVNYSKYLLGKNRLGVVYSGANGSGRKLSVVGKTCVNDTDDTGWTHMPYGWLRKSQSIAVTDYSCVPEYYGDENYSGAAQGCAVSCSPILRMASIQFPKAGF